MVKKVLNAAAAPTTPAGVQKVKKVIEKKAAPASKISRRFNKLRVKSGELDKRAVVYVGHLPKGFNEKELKKFFEQFGQVPKIRVSRSSKVRNRWCLK